MQYWQLEEALNKFKDITIVVVGDYFLDKYLIIDPEKDELSLETNLTAYQVVEKRISAGAAGTVVNNLKALGIGEIISVGIIGDDGEGLELRRALQSIGANTSYMIQSDKRVTPTYTKPMVLDKTGEVEINRLDIKNWKTTDSCLEDRIIGSLYDLAGKVDAIIALDQVCEENCGVITERVRSVLADIGSSWKDLVVYVDSRSFASKFTDVIVKCNQHELIKAVKPDFTGEENDDVIKECGHNMYKKTNKPVFVTCGSKGQIVFDGKRAVYVPALKVEGPLDICGAGDATTSGIVSGLCSGLNHEDSALLGNIIASITIQQLGTTGTASQQQVLERFKKI